MANKRSQDIYLGITRLEYGDASRPRRGVLVIETSKYYNGGLISDASVYWVGASSRQQMISLGSDGGDYRKRLHIDPSLKATQRNIDRQHAECFTAEIVAHLTRGAKEHYARYVRDGIDGFKNTYTEDAVAV